MIAHVEDRAAAADQNVIGKPAVEMNIVVGEQSVHVRAAHVLLIQIEHGNIGIVFEDHAGHDFVADM